MMVALIISLTCLGLLLLAGLAWRIGATPFLRRSPSLSLPTNLGTSHIASWPAETNVRVDQRHGLCPHAEDFTRRSGLSKSAAEDLLDWLQNHGRSDCEVIYHAADGFTVRRK